MATCPGRRSATPKAGIRVSQTSVSSSPQRSLLCATLLLLRGTHEVAALVDSGADANIISREAVPLTREPLSCPVPVRALDGHRLGAANHRIIPIDLCLTRINVNCIRFHILDQHRVLMVLGS